MIWTVLLKGIDGDEPYAVEADFADWSIDGKTLEFFDFSSLLDGILGLLQPIDRENKTSMQIREELLGWARSLAQTKVASFERERVSGFFIGTAPPKTRLDEAGGDEIGIP